jgi:ribonuclease Z
MPAYGRFTSAQLVEIQSRSFLVDCGEGTQMQLMKLQANLHRINHIFISHLHGDHYLGLIGLIFTMHLTRRTNDLHIYSHRGLDEIITIQFKHSQSAPSFKIIFHAMERDVREVIYDDDKLTVETIPLDHRIKCSGFLFKEKPKPRRIDKEKMPDSLTLQQIASLKRGDDITDEAGNIIYKNADYTLSPRRSRSYAYCSDTAYNEKMIEQISGVNILYHEATFTEDEITKATETFHSTAKQAAKIALKAKADKLLLGHFSARYRELDPILDEAKKVFGNCELAVEGMELTIQE